MALSFLLGFNKPQVLLLEKIWVEILLKVFFSYLTNISVLIKKDKPTSQRTSDTLKQMSEVVQKVSLNILTQVSVGHMVVVVVVVLLASLPSC